MSSEAPPGPPALPLTFRPKRTRAVLLTAGVLLCALFVGLALAIQAKLGERLSFVFVGALCLGVLGLLARPRVTAEEHGVTVVNLTSKRSLEWAEVLRVNLRSGDPWVYLDLADGTSLPAMGIQPGIGREQAVRDARALRALAETHGTGGAREAGDGPAER